MNSLTNHPKAHSIPMQSWQALWKKSWAILRARWYFRRATTLGSKSRIVGKAHVRNWGHISIGNRVRIMSTVATTEIIADGGTLEIGDGAFINYGCSIGATRLVHIGPNCNIGQHCIIIDNDFHHLDPQKRNERPLSRPIILEENVWLGARVIVLRGVTIGNGSVIGAGSVVTHDIPPNCLAVGQPAKVIRKL